MRFAKGFALLVVALCTFATPVDAGRRHFRAAPPSSIPTTVQADVFVSPQGNDAWTGLYPVGPSTDGPVATLDRARAIIRAKIADVGGSTRDFKVAIRGGSYYLSAPVVFSAADSAAPGHIVRYEAYGAEVPVISGGLDISTGWTNNAGIWQKTLTDAQTGNWNFRQLWINEERRMRPISPSQTTYLAAATTGAAVGGAASTSSLNVFGYTPGDVSPTLANLSDIDIDVQQSWTYSILNVANIDDTAHTVTTTGWTYGATNDSIKVGNNYRLHNVKENLVSQAGTFYLDRTPSGGSFTGVLNYNPKPGETINSLRIVAPKLHRLIIMSNAADGAATVSNIKFTGLTFANTDYFPPVFAANPGQGSIAAGDQGEVAAIHTFGASNIVFDRCVFRNLGGHAVQFGTGTSNSSVLNSILGDIGAGGIVASERTGTRDPNLVQNSNFLGSAVGSPGTLGPNWGTLGTSNGISAAVTGVGVENGIPYVDIHWSGTNSSGSSIIRSVGTTHYPFPASAPAYARAFITMPAGTMTGVSAIEFGTQSFTSGHAFLHGELQLQVTTPAASDLAANVYTATDAANDPAAAFGNFYFGVRINGSATIDITVRYGMPVVHDTSLDGLLAASGSVSQAISDLTFQNNLVIGYGRIVPGSQGILSGLASNVTIQNNEVADGYWSGIGTGYFGGPPYTESDAGNGWVFTPGNPSATSNLLVRRNFVHDIGQGVLSDLAGIYHLDRSDGSIIEENLVRNIMRYRGAAGYLGAGIYLDNGSSNLIVRKNTVYTADDSCFMTNPGTNNVITNNNFVNCVQVGMVASNSTGVITLGKHVSNIAMTFTNNNVTWNTDGTMTGRKGATQYFFLSAGYTFANNNFWQTVPSFWSDPIGPPVMVDASGNLWADWLTLTNDTTSTRNNPNLGGAPCYTPANPPAGWVSFDCTLAGRTSVPALPFPTPITTYP